MNWIALINKDSSSHTTELTKRNFKCNINKSTSNLVLLCQFIRSLMMIGQVKYKPFTRSKLMPEFLNITQTLFTYKYYKNRTSLAPPNAIHQTMSDKLLLICDSRWFQCSIQIMPTKMLSFSKTFCRFISLIWLKVESSKGWSINNIYAIDLVNKVMMTYFGNVHHPLLFIVLNFHLCCTSKFCGNHFRS